MAICSSCGEVLESNGQKFCSNCGAPNKATQQNFTELKTPGSDKNSDHLSTERSDNQPMHAEKKFPGTSQKISRIGIRYLTLGAIAVAALLIGLSFVPGLYSPLTSENMPSLSQKIPGDKLEEISNQVCSQLSALTPSESLLSEYQDQIATVIEVGEGNDGRDLRKLSRRVTWLAPSNQLSIFESQRDALIVNLLNETIDGLNILGINEENKDILSSKWFAEFEKSVKANCGFTETESRVASILSRYDSVMNRASEISASAPWYPEGYFEITSNLAGKYNTFEGSWPCSGCSFWKIKVVSETGCPGGVYLELNITQNNVVVDWTNDSLASLAPGEIGQMIFTNYPFIPNSEGEVTDANCY